MFGEMFEIHPVILKYGGDKMYSLVDLMFCV
jgi:hypothetical protein